MSEKKTIFFSCLATIVHPKQAPTGISVETLWEETKLKLLNTHVLICVCRVCVRICVYLRSTYINKEIQTERCCQACKSNTVIFINVLVSTSESHSPWDQDVRSDL